jgi:hypothetical protein
VSDQALLVVDHAALGQADGLPAGDDGAAGDQRPRPERPEVIDLQLERRERLALGQRREERHPHRGVDEVAEDPAVDRSHRVRVLLAGLEPHRALAAARLDEIEADKFGDRRWESH